MNLDEYKNQQPDESYYAPKEVESCDNCKEEEETFELGIESYGLKPTSKVCSFCLNQLHNNLTLTN